MTVEELKELCEKAIAEGFGDFEVRTHQGGCLDEWMETPQAFAEPNPKEWDTVRDTGEKIPHIVLNCGEA